MRDFGCCDERWTPLGPLPERTIETLAGIACDPRPDNLAELAIMVPPGEPSDMCASLISQAAIRALCVLPPKLACAALPALRVVAARTGTHAGTARNAIEFIESETSGLASPGR